jgi:cation diffusion facilitator family transporter
MEKCDYLDIQSNKQIRFTALCGLMASITLVIVKFVLGILGNSYAVIADGVESISDTVTDITLVLGIQFWSAPPDENHPYGHRRIETIITAFIGVMLLFAAFFIIYKAISGMAYGKREDPVSGIALLAPVIAIIIKESIYRWTLKVSKKLKSQVLYANAWHHRSDAITSVVTLIAIFVSRLNEHLYIVDNIGGIVCSILIMRVAYKIIRPALDELSDSGASEKTRKQIEEVSLRVKEIKSVHKIRTRKMGSVVFADLHMLVDGNTTVRKGHDIANVLQDTLKKSVPELIDIVIHIEPND